MAVVLSGELLNGFFKVDCRVKVLSESVIANFISVFALQAGCSTSEKKSFWEQYEEVLLAIYCPKCF